MRIRLDLEGTREEIEALFESVFSDGKTRELLATAINTGIVSASAKEDHRHRDSIFDVLSDVSWTSFLLIHLLYVYGEDVQGGKSATFDTLMKMSRCEPRSISNCIGGTNKVATREGVKPFLKIISGRGKSEKKCFLSSSAYEGIEYCLEQWDDDYRFKLNDIRIPYPGE